jgi:hypothetical protein
VFLEYQRSSADGRRRLAVRAFVCSFRFDPAGSWLIRIDSVPIGAGEFKFGLAQRDGREENRQKPPRIDPQAQSVHHPDQAEPEEVVHELVPRWIAAQFPRPMGQRSAGRDPDGDPRHGGPQHIDQRPAQAEFTELVQSEQSHPQHHKRKGAAVMAAGGELHQIAGRWRAPALTTNQGVALSDNQNSLRANPRGPTLLEDFILREKITHFDHERIPERIVHARGTGVHGFFELTASLKTIHHRQDTHRGG